MQNTQKQAILEAATAYGLAVQHLQAHQKMPAKSKAHKEEAEALRKAKWATRGDLLDAVIAATQPKA